MAISLKDKVVLVIGASSGIGRATALLFAGAGAKVVASARRADRLRELEEEAAGAGFAVKVQAADASKAEEMKKLVDGTQSSLGPIDILVYAAGTNIPARALSVLNPETWNMMLDSNLNGAYYATYAVLPGMRAAKGGLLLYISSISGLMADASGASYQAAKRGLVGLAHAARFEERQNGIRTCVVCPGLVDTELVQKRPVKPTREILEAALQPEDVAEMIIAIASLPPRAVVPEIQILPTTL
ncbi:MAG: SDR family oxidoreductase [Bryobacteraceae bacterium]